MNFLSGEIENRVINKAIVDALDGTTQAYKN